MHSFSSSDAYLLLMTSEHSRGEGAADGTGHTLRSHVHIDNEQLMNRLYWEGQNGKINWKSAFLDQPQAASALADTLNKIRFELDHLIDGRRKKIEGEYDISGPYDVRIATGSGCQVFQSSRMRVVAYRCLEPKADDPFKFMIMTFFPCPPDSLVRVMDSHTRRH